jgi:phytoene dehydrogenase-like protein
MADWIEAATGNADVRALLRMLTRVATYCDDFEAISATVAVRQVRAAARTGVLYIDGGWQSMVDGLRQAATDAGVEIRTGCKATAISGVGSDTGLTVAIAGTSSESAAATQPTKAAKAERTAGIPADAVVVSSGGPATANDLLAAGGNASAELHTSASQAVPVRATTLDVHLSELPRPDMRVCFPTGEPLYLSVHTPSANLARTGEVMHLLWYGEHDDSVRNRMEALAERVQPCWREHVLAERFGRSLVVAHDRPTGHDTTAVEVADSPGVFVAGDWVFPTPEVLLADAAVLSGRRAGEAAAATAATPGTSTKGAQRAPIG